MHSLLGSKLRTTAYLPCSLVFQIVLNYWRLGAASEFRFELQTNAIPSIGLGYCGKEDLFLYHVFSQPFYYFSSS